MDQWSKTTSHFSNGIRIQCNAENFVPIVVPGLSASSSFSSHSSTSMTLSRQENDHLTSSSSSSTSPTTTVLSDSGTRERKYLSGIDSHPVLARRHRTHVVRVVLGEKTADIQARSFMVRTLEDNGKECQAEGKAKSGLKKRFILKMNENCEEFISSTLRIRNSKKTL